MRHFVFASHAHFAEGVYESIKLLLGERDDVSTLCMFVDGNDDIAECVAATVASVPAEDDLVVCTDILGGSVCNEFTKVVADRPHTYLAANMSLPLLIQVLFADPDAPTDEVMRAACASEEVTPKYVNDLLAEAAEEEEEF